MKAMDHKAMAFCKSKSICMLLFKLIIIVNINLCINNLVLINAELKKFEHPAKADGSLSFLVIGDWGRRGLYNQSQVANQVLIN